MRYDALVLTGATATGKTAVALALAERLGGEIVSMDSRQVYRGMDIGTAKATAAERERVPHHGLDLVAPGERYSAGAFARDARRWVGEIRARGHVPLLVGGTGFFLRALTHPLFREPPLDPDRRERLRAWLAGEPDIRLNHWLERLDPPGAVRLAGWGGRQRLERALEVALLTGRSLSWWHAHAPTDEAPLALQIFLLELPRTELFRRIDARVLHMLGQGFEAEVRALVELGYDERAAGMSATGYGEMLRLVRGELPLESATEAIQRATRRYARRQLTWFRHQLAAGVVRLDGTRSVDALVASIVESWGPEGTA